MSDWRATARDRLPRLSPRSAPQLYTAAVERARLTVVPRQRVRAPRTPFVVLVAALLLGGVVGLLLFNTHMQQGSFRASALEVRATQMNATLQGLQMEVDRLRDPQEVARRAQELGMVPIANPAFLTLPDGRTLGEARPASPLDAQRLTALPARKPADYRPPARRVPWDGTTDGATDRATDRATDGATDGATEEVTGAAAAREGTRDGRNARVMTQ